MLALIRNTSVKTFANQFGKLMSIRTGKVFLCIYYPNLENTIEIPIRKKSKKIKIKPFVRTLLPIVKHLRLLLV